MATTVYGHLYKFLDDNTTVPETGVVEFAPWKRPALTKVGTEWVEESDLPRKAEADEHGKWTQDLPLQADSDPSDQEWIITLPDGKRYQGIVPSTGGPFTIKDLKDDHGWTLLNPSDPLQFVAGYTTVQADGTARPQQSIIDFGPGLTAVDDPTNHRTVVDVNVSADVTPAAVVTALASAASDVSINTHKLTHVVAGAAGTDAVNKTQMDTADTGVQTAAATDATTKANAALGAAETYADGVVTSVRVQAATAALASDLSVNSKKIVSLGTPTADTDAATKKYVDDNAGGTPTFAGVKTALGNADSDIVIGGTGNGLQLNSPGGDSAVGVLLNSGSANSWPTLEINSTDPGDFGGPMAAVRNTTDVGQSMWFVSGITPEGAAFFVAQVLVGADGTGPGGVGRALYIVL